MWLHVNRGAAGTPWSRIDSWPRRQTKNKCNSQTEEVMIAKNRSLSRASPPSKRNLLRASIAGALAAGALTCTPAVDARIVSVQMSAPTIAFGGFVFTGVGRYV